MKLFTAVIFIFFSLTVFHVTGTAAENRVKAFTVSPLIGGYIFDSDQSIKTGPAFGIVLGYNMSERIGIEGAFHYVDTEVGLSNLSNSVHASVYRFEGLYHFKADKVVLPYVAAGAGALTIDVDGVGDSTVLLFNYGAGIKYFFTESLAFRAGIRHIISSEDTNHDILFKFGLSYLIGAKPKKEAPKPMPVDSDGDGVYDDHDQCTGTPSGAAVDSSGCPLDSDRDGVYDYEDTCIGTPADTKVDTSGCPLPVKEEVSIEMNVSFASNSAVVQNKFHDDIEKVSNFLKTYPDAIAVIEGHTDSAGDDQHNLQLSQQRADNVLKHLVDDGIHPSRLKAEGYGESRPIADNSTAEGRQKNRRVIAVISVTVLKKPDIELQDPEIMDDNSLSDEIEETQPIDNESVIQETSDDDTEIILKKPDIEREDPGIIDDNSFSSEIEETQPIDSKSVTQETSDDDTDAENKLNGKLQDDDRFVSRAVYTIQTGSYTNKANALEQVDSLLQSHNKEDREFLRIEKFGKYYTVRLGKFENYAAANKFIREVKPGLPEAVILKADIKNENIIEWYE